MSNRSRWSDSHQKWGNSENLHSLNPAERLGSTCCLRLPEQLKPRRWVWGNLTPTSCSHSARMLTEAAHENEQPGNYQGVLRSARRRGGDEFSHEGFSDWQTAVCRNDHPVFTSSFPLIDLFNPWGPSAGPGQQIPPLCRKSSILRH